MQTVSQGDNAPFNQIILRAPGVAQDSAANGDLHVRGEHANLQYRINDVLLPEGITGFGLELDPRFVESMQLITGSLPAAYGFRTAGVVDIKTKSGAFENGGEAEIYGGSYDTLRPSFEYGGSDGKLNYFIDGSYDHNALGIENPTVQPQRDPRHDRPIQDVHVFVLHPGRHQPRELHGQRVLQRFPSAEHAGSAGWALIVRTASTAVELPAAAAPNFQFGQPERKPERTKLLRRRDLSKIGGRSEFPGLRVRPRQRRAFHARSDWRFVFQRRGQRRETRRSYSGGLQADASYDLGDKHTIRGGALLLDESVQADSTTTVFPVDASGNPTGPAFPIVDNNTLNGQFYGVYLQDEWKMFSKLTVNYGARFDVFNSSFDNEYQFSPRVNLIYKPTDSTTLARGLFALLHAAAGGKCFRQHGGEV